MANIDLTPRPEGTATDDVVAISQEIVQLYGDENHTPGNERYPVTVADAVITSNGKTLAVEFSEEQAARTTAFNTSEAQRTATFNSKEAERDAAMATIESEAETLTELSQKVNEFYKYTLLQTLVFENNGGGKFWLNKGGLVAGQCRLENITDVTEINLYTSKSTSALYRDVSYSFEGSICKFDITSEDLANGVTYIRVQKANATLNPTGGIYSVKSIKDDVDSNTTKIDAIDKQINDGGDILGTTEHWNNNTIISVSSSNTWYPFRLDASNIAVSNDCLTITTIGTQAYEGLRRVANGLVNGKTYIVSFEYKTPTKLIFFYKGSSSLISQDIFNTDNEWHSISAQFTMDESVDRLQIGTYAKYLGTYQLRNISVCDVAINSLVKRVETLEATQSHPLQGKNVAIIGDSISTIYGNNTPYWTIKSIDVGQSIQSYVTWWDVWSDGNGTIATNKTIGGVALTSAMIGTLQTFTPVSGDVGKVIGVADNYNQLATKVWSQVLCEKTGANLLANASWSGASMCDGQTGAYAISHAFSPLTIGRCKVRDDEGNFVNPDVIFIYRGTNDFSHTQGGRGYSRLDEYDLVNGYPTTDINGESNYSFRRAYYMTIKALREAYPNAIIYCCTLNVFKRITFDRYPTRNGLNTLIEYNDCIRDIANKMGCGLVEFDKDGITFENCYSGGYITDSATNPTHPNSVGHAVMAAKAIEDCRHTL